MRTTLDIDERLMKEAMEQTGARTKTELVEAGLRALLQREARKRLRALFGARPEVEPARRRR